MSYALSFRPSAVRDLERLPALVQDRLLGRMEALANDPRVGEDHTRGRDLPDGLFCRETWDNIVAGIVRAEAVKIHQKPHYLADEMSEDSSGGESAKPLPPKPTPLRKGL